MANGDEIGAVVDRLPRGVVEVGREDVLNFGEEATAGVLDADESLRIDSHVFGRRDVRGGLEWAGDAALRAHIPRLLDGKRHRNRAAGDAHLCADEVAACLRAGVIVTDEEDVPGE